MKTETFIIAFLTLAMIFFTEGLVGAADFHVTSAQELQTALSVATNNGEDDTVLLAAGTYAGRFTFLSAESLALTIKADAGLNPGQVVLNGENLGRVLTLTGGDNNVNFTVDNLTLENGSVNYHGGGLYVGSTSGTLLITHCIVKNNKTSGSNNRYGGGIFLNVANNVTLSGNIITGNDNDDNGGNSGGGVYIDWATTLLFDKNTISDNLAYQCAGAVYIRDAEDISFVDNTISNNSVRGNHGGAVYFEQPVNTIIFQGNRIHKNHAKNYYGAIYINSAALSITFTENTISENSANYNSAISTYNNTPTITFANNIITNNTATLDYGPVYLNKFTDLVFTDNLVSGNSARYMGAGRLGADSHNSITFTGNIVSNNSATNNNYGGLYLEYATTTYIANNVITGNSCINGRDGGLAVSAGANLDFINNTIANNSATGKAGGVCIYTGAASVVNFYNNIAFGNSAAGGADIWLSGSGTINGYNNAYQELEGLWSFEGNNSNTAPLFVDEANDDFHLSPASLLINTGDNSAPALPATDLDGNPRIADITVDLGAYEHTTDGCHPADVNLDWVITAAEAADYGDAWRTGATWTIGPNPIPIDYATRAGYLSTQNSGVYKNIGGGQPTNWVPGP